jgi:20S proteasome subunit beta 7
MPYVTGTSVLGLTYKDGVIIASDMLGSYGSTKRYKSVQRVQKVNESTIIGASGELSDFQYIMDQLSDVVTDDFCMDDGVTRGPKEIFSWLSRVLYGRRNKFDPLWNSLVIGGVEDGKPFLGTVGMIGTSYSSSHIATGFGNHLAMPLFRERHSPDMSEGEATALMHDALRVCYYRDKNSINKFQTASVTSTGVKISEPFSLETNWSFKHFVDPTVNAVGAW